MLRIPSHPPVPVYDGFVRVDHTRQYLKGVPMDPRTSTAEE